MEEKIIDKCTSYDALNTLDVTSEKYMLDKAKTTIGIEFELELKSIKASRGDRESLVFYTQKFIQTFVKHLQSKGPLRNTLIKNSEWLHPGCNSQ